MTKYEKIFLNCSIAISFLIVTATQASAMHIMEGYLPLAESILWSVISIPFLAMGIISIKRIAKNDRKAILILAMAGAYTFVLSSLKIPSVTGSSSHPTGTGLGAIIFGPMVMVVIGLIVLLFQALLLAHGGLSTLGANTFSMAIAGPFLTYGVYILLNKLKVNKKISIFTATALGALFTYAVTSVQLGLAHPSAVGGAGSSIIKFMSIFAITQIPLAIVEGIITVIAITALEEYAKDELTTIGFINKGACYEKTI